MHYPRILCWVTLCILAAQIQAQLIDRTVEPPDLPIHWGPVTFDSSQDKISVEVKTPAYDETWHGDGSFDDYEDWYRDLFKQSTSQTLPSPPIRTAIDYLALPVAYTGIYHDNRCVLWKTGSGHSWSANFVIGRTSVSIVLTFIPATSAPSITQECGSLDLKRANIQVNVMGIEWENIGTTWIPKLLASSVVTVEVYSATDTTVNELAFLSGFKSTVLDNALTSAIDAYLATEGLTAHVLPHRAPSNSFTAASVGLVAFDPATVFVISTVFPDFVVMNYNGIANMIDPLVQDTATNMIASWSAYTPSVTFHEYGKQILARQDNVPEFANQPFGIFVQRRQSPCTNTGTPNYYHYARIAGCDDGYLIEFYVLSQTSALCASITANGRQEDDQEIDEYYMKVTIKATLTSPFSYTWASKYGGTASATAVISQWLVQPGSESPGTPGEYLVSNFATLSNTQLGNSIDIGSSLVSSGTATPASMVRDILFRPEFDMTAFLPLFSGPTGGLFLSGAFAPAGSSLPGDMTMSSTFGTYCPYSQTINPANSAIQLTSEVSFSEVQGFNNHPVAYQYMDLSFSLLGPNDDGVSEHVVRRAEDMGTCASMFPTITLANVNDTAAIDTILRDGIDDHTIYIPTSSPAATLYSPTPVSYTSVPNQLTLNFMYDDFAANSIVDQLTTVEEGGRHFNIWRFSATLTQLRQCKARRYNGDLDEALEIENPTPGTEFDPSSFNKYTVYPTWIALLPQQLSKRRGGMITSMRKIILRIFTTSRTTQIIDSGRRMDSELISMNPRVGPSFGCDPNQGRLEITMELAFAKENPSDNNEIIGIRHFDEITPSFDDPGYPNCYEVPVSPFSQLHSSYQSLDQWSDPSICTAPLPGDSTNQFGGCPYCPENQGICYQRVVMTTECYPLQADGRTFSSNDDCPRYDYSPLDGSTCGVGIADHALCPTLPDPDGVNNPFTGHMHFKFKPRVCNNIGDWIANVGDGVLSDTDPLTRVCWDSPSYDNLRLIAHETRVYAPDDESDNRVRVQMEMAVFREVDDTDFDADAISNTTDFEDADQGTFVYQQHRHLIPRYTRHEKVTAAVRPRHTPYQTNYPIAIADIWVCKGDRIAVLNAQKAIQDDAFDPTTDFCNGFTEKLEVYTNGAITQNCLDSNMSPASCLTAAYDPKDLQNVLNNGPATISNFPLCSGNMGCDAFALDMAMIIRSLKKTFEEEVYMFDVRVVTGAIQTAPAGRRLLQNGDSDEEIDFQHVGQIFYVDYAENIFYTDIDLAPCSPHQAHTANSHGHHATTPLEVHEAMLLQRNSELADAQEDEEHYRFAAMMILLSAIALILLWVGLLCSCQRSTVSYNSQKAVQIINGRSQDDPILRLTEPGEDSSQSGAFGPGSFHF